MTEIIETTISTIIIPLIGIAVMAGIYFITRNKQTEDTTLLNNADIKNIITETKDRQKQQEEWNKEIKEDVKSVLKQVTEINNTVNIHEYRLKNIEKEEEEQRRRRRDEYGKGNHKQGGYKEGAV